MCSKVVSDKELGLRPGPFSTQTFSLFLSPACNPNACRASGRGLQPKGVRVKEMADFKVFTKGAGSGELKVTVKGPSECQVPGLGDWTVVLTI